MRQFFRVFLAGMMISFVGSLPLGSLNVAAMQIAITDGYAAALSFATGLLLVEIIYVRISLVAMDKIRKQEKVLKALEWVTLIIVVSLAISSFVAAARNSGESKNILLSNGMPRFVLGLVMSAVNPVQIPFWFGWSTVLFTKKILLPQNNYYNIYILGIGTGTFMATSVFIFGGKWAVEKLNTNQHTLHLIIGVIFTITSLIQAWKMFLKKDAAQKIHDIKNEDLPPKKLTEKNR